MIVGVCGLISSGKGTVGDYLATTYGFKKIAFADSLKDAVSIVFGWPRHLLEGDTEESRVFRETTDLFWSKKFGYTVTPRYMLQIVGTEAFRNGVNQDIWIHALEKKIDSNPNTNYVVTDVRFFNEIDMVRRRYGKVIKVFRQADPEWYKQAALDNTTGSQNMKTLYPYIHQSEWGWMGAKFDYEINNDSDLKSLYNKVDIIFQ